VNPEPTALAFDDALLARIEDAGVNASAPREQRWVDGWLLRLSPGKAKRARCIQPVAPGRLGIDAKLALCLPMFAAAGLRPYVRITPFSEPPGLDEHLGSLGMVRIDDTRVMVLASIDALAAGEVAAATDAGPIEPADAPAFAEWVGAARGSTAGERRAHAERIGHGGVVDRCAQLDAEGGPLDEQPERQGNAEAAGDDEEPMRRDGAETDVDRLGQNGGQGNSLEGRPEEIVGDADDAEGDADGHQHLQKLGPAVDAPEQEALQRPRKEDGAGDGPHERRPIAPA